MADEIAAPTASIPTPNNCTTAPATQQAQETASPDVWVIFVAGTVLFLLGHGGILFGKSPAGPVAFLITCFVWGVLFGYPAYLCRAVKLRIARKAIGLLFLLAAGLELAIPVYIRHETETKLSEVRAQLSRTFTPSEIPQGNGFFDALPQGNGIFDQFMLASGGPTELAAPAYLRQKLKSETTWEQVAPGLKEKFGVDPEQYRQQYQLHFARRQQLLKSESVVEYLVRRALPVASAISMRDRTHRYIAALERFNVGKSSQEDIDVIARFEWLEELDGKRSD